MFFIKIRKFNYIVQLKYLILFLRWYLRYQTTFSAKLKLLLKLPLLVQFRGVQPETLSEELCFPKRKIAWIRWKKDLSKLQVFNLTDSLIGKVQLNRDKKGFQKETDIMKVVGPLSIPIIELNNEKMYFIEPYIHDFFIHHSNLKIEELYALLKKHLYQPYKVNTINFISDFSSPYREKLDIEIKKINLKSLLLTKSHGDLWYKNTTNYEGKLVLCDWEYSRITVLSYDLWHYLFMQYKTFRKSIDESFFKELKNILKLIGTNKKYTTRETKILHLIHLCEKIHFYKRFNSQEYLNDIEQMDKLFFKYFNRNEK